jgi:plasmid maintenance system antidote protein VapI
MEGDKAAGRSGFRPVHPGRIIKRNIDALGLTIEAFADHIGTSRQTVHAIHHPCANRGEGGDGRAPSAGAFKTTPQFGLNLQSNHVVWELEHLHRLDRIRPLKKRVGQRPRGTSPILGRRRAG